MPRARNILLILVGLYVVNYLVTPVLVGPRELEVYFRPHFARSFDSETWKNSGWIADGKHGRASSSFGERYDMVDDLLASHISIGMGADQVRAAIGEPDAGIVDRKLLLATPDPYGGHKLNPAKEILDSPDQIAIWAYHLAYQHQYPARSMWFPKFFANFDEWKLLVEMRNGKVSELRVDF